MKRLIYLFCTVIALNACTDDSGIFTPDENGIKEPTLPVDTISNEQMSEAAKVFEKLNLEYPGLEKVKLHVEMNEYSLAAHEVLSYYRNRGKILNPNINLINHKASEVDINKANQAIDYRFCVAKYVEKVNDEKNPADDVYYSFKGKEDNINWGYKPNVKSIDREFLYQQHRHQWMEPQAKAYYDLRNENYIKSWIEVYSDWMKKYPCPNMEFPQGEKEIKDLESGYEWKGLQPAERVLAQTNIIQYYLSSPNFTPEWLCTVLNAYAESVEMVRMNYYREGNIRITQGQAVATAGILMPEFKNAEAWIADGIGAMDIDSQFRADGVHTDLDFSYHMGAIADYLEIYEVAKANNKLSLLPANFISTIEGAVNFVQDMIYPDYTIDNFNDTRSSSFAKSTLMNRLKDYLKIFPNNQQLRWMAWEGQKGGLQPSWTSHAYTNSGYYMFKSQRWSSNAKAPQGIMMIHKNNENSEKRWHCQPDNGTFSLWYNGLNLLPDAGVSSYDNNEERYTYRQSTMHNTMSVHRSRIDEDNQKGKFLLHKSSSEYDVIVTENTPYKANKKIKEGSYVPKGDISHRRAIFFVNNEFFVIADEAYSTSKEENAEINFNYHLYSEGAEAQLDNEHKTIFSNLSKQNLLIKAFSETNTKFRIEKSKKTDIKVSNQSGQKIGEVRNWVLINETMAPGKAVRMITVLYPTTGSNKKDITASFVDNTPEAAGTMHNGVAIKLTVDGKEYTLSYTL